jgi:hypothetical protein
VTSKKGKEAKASFPFFFVSLSLSLRYNNNLFPPDGDPSSSLSNTGPAHPFIDSLQLGSLCRQKGPDSDRIPSPPDFKHSSTHPGWNG